MEADVTHAHRARGGELQAMTLRERRQLHVLRDAGENRAMAADELISLAAHQDALPVENRGGVTLGRYAGEIERHRARHQRALGESSNLGLKINGKKR